MVRSVEQSPEGVNLYLALFVTVALLGSLAGLAFFAFRRGASAMREKILGSELDAAKRISAASERSSATISELKSRLDEGGKL